MRDRNVLLLTVVSFVAALALAATPARALAPEGWTIAFGNVSGQLMDCVRFKPCSSTSCRARAIYSGVEGRCTRAVQFEPGRSRMSCSFKNIEWSFWAPRSKEMVLDVTCSRLGGAYDHLAGKYSASPPLSCGATVTHRKIRLTGRPKNLTESYFGLTVGRGLSCRTIFGASLTDLEWEKIRLEGYAN